VSRFLGELQKAENAIVSKLVYNRIEKEIIQISDDHKLVSKLVQFHMSPGRLGDLSEPKRKNI